MELKECKSADCREDDLLTYFALMYKFGATNFFILFYMTKKFGAILLKGNIRN
jgi:hypothetical protein